jgi:HK97 gp10 family phage protein
MIISHVAEVLAAKEEAIQQGLLMCAVTCEGHAVGAAPVDTGRLRASITHEVAGHTATIGTSVEYAPYVELGTSKMAAQPYLKPALADHTGEYQAMFRSAFS